MNEPMALQVPMVFDLERMSRLRLPNGRPGFGDATGGSTHWPP